MAQTVVVNRWKDLLDRAGWTAIQASAGALFVWLTSDGVTWQNGAKAVAVATAIAVVKVVLAQRVGDTNDGAAIPGGVIEPQ